MDSIKPWLPFALLTKFQEVSLIFADQKITHLQASILESPAYVPLDKHGAADALHWSKDRDILIEVGLSVQTLVKLGMVSGQLMEIQNASSGISHVARVVALGFDKEMNSGSERVAMQEEDRMQFPLRGVAYASPMLVQSLQLNCALAPFLFSNELGSPHQVPPERVVFKPIRRSSSGEGIPVGTKVVIQKVAEPYQSHFKMMSEAASEITKSGNTSMEQALKQFFDQTKRFVSLGDVIGLSIDSTYKPKAPWEMFQPGFQSQQLAFHCFRVIEVEPDDSICVIVDPQTTMVSLKGGRAWGSIPIGLKEYTQSALHTPQLSYEISGIGDIPARSPTASLSSQALETLGDTVSASRVNPGTLKGVGPLLPGWRDVATVVCPVLHSLALELEFRVSVLLKGPRGCGRRTAAEGAARALGMKFITFDCLELQGPSDSATSAKLTALFHQSLEFAPCVLLLKNVEVLCKKDSDSPLVVAALYQLAKSGCSKAVRREGDKKEKRLVVVVGTASGEGLAPSIRHCFTHEISIEPPDMEGRSMLLQHFLGPKLNNTSNVLAQAVKQTEGYFPKDLRALVADTVATAVSRSRSWTQDSKKNVLSPSSSQGIPKDILDPDQSSPASSSHLHLDRMTGQGTSTLQGSAMRSRGSGLSVTDEVKWIDFEAALDRVQKRTARDVGAPKIPNVRWEDVGGLEDVKKVILETVELPMKHKELFSSGIQHRSGVLLYGPPGVGKTLIAKAIATECSINFLSVKGPELLNMYIGESERHVREVFERARRAKPCVVFFDELDSIAPARGASGDSAGVMDRVVSQLLAEVDDVQASNTDIFIFGATNRPDLVDPALMRPGRLDSLVYVGLPADSNARAKILRALTRKFHLAQDINLVAISELCSQLFTGADLYALCADAWMVAMKAMTGGMRLEEGFMDGKDQPDFKIVVSQNDFLEALGKLKPSLTEEQMLYYKNDQKLQLP